MPLFDYPTADEILDDTGLRPEQVNTKYTTDQLKADITQKVGEAGPIIERRILAATSPEPWPFSETDMAIALPKYSVAARSERQDGQKETARTAVKFLALHFLYDRSGQLNAKYQDKATEYREDVERLLTGMADGTGKEGLLGELRGMAESITAGVPDGGESDLKFAFSVSPRRVDGYNAIPDEYSRSSWRGY